MQDIPNLQLTHIAGPQYADDDLHYEALGTLASQLGRQMFMHRHDRYFQVHYVLEGPVRVQLEDRVYRLQGPMVFLTPPAFVHAFVTDDHADGHVLTVRQQLLRPLLNDAASWSGGAHVAPLCLALAGLDGEAAHEARRMDGLFGQLQQEYTGQRHGRAQSLALLAQLIFISLLRLSPRALESPPACRETLQLFLGFSTLMEDGFCRHWPIPHYAGQLGISEQRLNEICHGIAGKPPKRLINERLMQEARRLLLYTNQPVSQVGYRLGFEDPAYFGRFFLRHAGQTPGNYRSHMALRLAPAADRAATLP
ncbi:4-hydroxyphenylacetate catabolism regulatory protein HpaA [Castellaniella hirudinis]|uniref:4-hydroxyphenylacetate catabolism regulatory protein HpaA n=1 Tax=Castellaniella hirudinis TaxID=1144617 RepID=UPI0039C27A49